MTLFSDWKTTTFSLWLLRYKFYGTVVNRTSVFSNGSSLIYKAYYNLFTTKTIFKNEFWIFFQGLTSSAGSSVGLKTPEDEIAWKPFPGETTLTSNGGSVTIFSGRKTENKNESVLKTAEVKEEIHGAQSQAETLSRWADILFFFVI